MTVSDTGQAGAFDGGSAVTGYKGPPGTAGPVQVSGTGPAIAVEGGIAISGAVVMRQPRLPAPWPHQVGAIPLGARPFQLRQELVHLRTALEGGGTAVLCPAAGHSGAVGKTQLAAKYARSAWEAGDLDVLIWIPAGTHAEVLENYAQAAEQLVPTDTNDQERAARELLAWLESKAGGSACRWLVVLDGVAVPGDLRDLWPPACATGRVLVTTRCSGSLLEGADWQVVPLGPYSPSEALEYLTTVIAGRSRYEPAGELAGLADDLHHMPSALAQAAADLLGTGLSCGDYRRLLADEATAAAAAADPAVGDWTRCRSLLLRSRRRRVVAFLTRPFQRRSRVSAPDRHRQRMLKKVLRRADDMASRAEAFYIPPAFQLMATQQTGGRRRRKAEDPSWQPCEASSLRELYDRSGGDLVLLSRPGMGKTLQLSRLARELAGKALADEARLAEGTRRPPIPVLLSLSTYRGEPLRDWLVAEINRSYDIARPLVTGWIAADALLPLLDGLDQVPEEHRCECAAQIRRFREHCTGLVLTCRDRDRHLAARVNAACCALLEPPSRSWVQRYLNSGAEAMTDVRAALSADPSLWELLQSPLMLSIVRQAYANAPATELRDPGTTEQREARVLDAYVRHMLEHRPSRYASARTLRWLTWLARTLGDRGEDILYLDRMDETWASATRHSRLVTYGPHAVFLALTLAMSAGWLALARESAPKPLNPIDVLVTVALLFLVGANWTFRFSPADGGTHIIRAAVPAILAALVLIGRPTQLGSLSISLTLVWALVCITIAERKGGRAPAEQVRWGSRLRVTTQQAFRLASVEGIVLGLWVVLPVLALGARPSEVWMVGGTVGMFVVSYLDWFQPDVKQNRDTPAEGIRRSARHALAFGTARIIAVLLFLTPLLSVGPQALPARLGLLASFLVAVQFGLATTYQYGGLAFLHHWSLRLALAWSGVAPLRYQRFLRDAEQRILIQRIGSGYAFPHALLQRHIASSAAEPITEKRGAGCHADCS